MTTARFLDVSTEAYHKDPCAFPSLSSSIGNKLITESPLHAWQAHPRLGGKSSAHTSATTDGTVLHALLLKAGLEQIAIIDVDNFQTKAAKEARDAAMAAGKCVIKTEDFITAQKAAERIKARLKDEYGIELTGLSEQKIEWTEETTEGPALCRGMLDHFITDWDHNGGITIYDLKKIRSADLFTCQTHIRQYSYDLQASAYVSAMGKVCPEAAGRINYRWLFVEIDEPNAVTPLEPDGQMRLMGDLKWERACRIWAKCMRTKNWPAYVEKVTPIGPAHWELDKGSI